MELEIQFVKVHPNAQLPKSAHEFGDAGFDLYAVEDRVMSPGAVTVLRTGLQLANCPDTLPDGNQYYLDIRSRSGLSRNLIFPVTGTVDRNYRGEIGVVLANMNTQPYQIKQGDRIAQMVVQVIYANGPTTRVKFSETTEVTESDRGSGGFGSSGK